MLEANKFYVDKDNKYVYIHEITRYNHKYSNPDGNICSIVTGVVCDFKKDSKTTCIRQIFSRGEFLSRFKLVEDKYLVTLEVSETMLRHIKESYKNEPNKIREIKLLELNED